MAEFSSDPSLSVLSEPPEDCIPGLGLIGPRTVRSRDYRRNYYECRHCRGWVEGYPHEIRVNNIGFLSGRCGIEFYCVRCGQEIGFSGMMA